MKLSRVSIALAITALAVVARDARAWGEKGHAISSEAATLTLPTDMPPFFYRAFPDLIWLANDPDRWRGAGESIESANAPEHFIDYEYVAGLQLPPQRYPYIDLLYTTGTLRRYAISNSTIGFLPWRVAEMCERLTNEWRQWRFSLPGSSERRTIERSIVRDAGVLGHYVADAANPLHTTLNYNGWVMPNPNGYANDCLIHARFESEFVTRAVVTADVLPKVAAPQLRADYFSTELEFVRQSNAQTEELYRIDRAGGFDIFRPVSPVAKEFAARRLAAGASLLRDFWWSTWKSSANPPPRRRAVE